MSARLEVDSVAHAFAGVRALDGVSLSIASGERVALIGPNGAGKSTLFNVVHGQIRPDAGQVRIDGVDVTGASSQRLFRLGVGRTFQVAATFGSMTVIQNVELALAMAKSRGALQRLERADDAAARELLAATGLAAVADRAASTLPWPVLKRVEFAMALANQPRLLLMDEPTAGLAPDDRRDLMALVVALAASRDCALLFTEHSMDVVFEHATRIVVLARGRIVADDVPGVIAEDPRVREVYLGSLHIAAKTAQ
ncbi:ABC transporter ATP-binding protein [soil metagenome]